MAAAGGELQQSRSLLGGEVVQRRPEPGDESLPVPAAAAHQRVRTPVRHRHLAGAAHQKLSKIFLPVISSRSSVLFTINVEKIYEECLLKKMRLV